MRVRPDEQHGNHELVSFNPRTREGATHQLIWHVPQRNSFNPRTREGATYADKYEDGSYMVSIHAPVRVRLPPLFIQAYKKCFNPRTREGATA